MNGGSFIIPPEFKDKVIEFVDKLNLIHQRERHWYWVLVVCGQNIRPVSI